MATIDGPPVEPDSAPFVIAGGKEERNRQKTTKSWLAHAYFLLERKTSTLDNNSSMLVNGSNKERDTINNICNGPGIYFWDVIQSQWAIAWWVTASRTLTELTGTAKHEELGQVYLLGKDKQKEVAKLMAAMCLLMFLSRKLTQFGRQTVVQRYLPWKGKYI